MTTNYEYEPTTVKLRSDHRSALLARVDDMGGTVTLHYFVNEALDQYLAPKLTPIEGDDVR